MSAAFEKANVEIENYIHAKRLKTEHKLASRKEYNPKDQSEEMHFVMAGYN